MSLCLQFLRPIKKQHRISGRCNTAGDGEGFPQGAGPWCTEPSGGARRAASTYFRHRAGFVGGSWSSGPSEASRASGQASSIMRTASSSRTGKSVRDIRSSWGNRGPVTSQQGQAWAGHELEDVIEDGPACTPRRPTPGHAALGAENRVTEQSPQQLQGSRGSREGRPSSPEAATLGGGVGKGTDGGCCRGCGYREGAS